MNSCFQELPNYCQTHDCGCKQEDSKPICKPTSRIGALLIDEFPYINVIGGYHASFGTHRAVVFDLPEETKRVWRFNIFTRTWKAMDSLNNNYNNFSCEFCDIAYPENIIYDHSSTSTFLATENFDKIYKLVRENGVFVPKEIVSNPDHRSYFEYRLIGKDNASFYLIKLSRMIPERLCICKFTEVNRNQWVNEILYELSSDNEYYNFIIDSIDYSTGLNLSRCYTYKNFLVFLQQNESYYTFQMILIFDCDIKKFELILTTGDSNSQQNLYPTNRYGFSGLVLNDKFYVFGGCREENDIWYPATDNWSLNLITYEWNLLNIRLARCVNDSSILLSPDKNYICLFGGKEIPAEGIPVGSNARYPINAVQILWLAPKSLLQIAIETLIKMYPKKANDLHNANPIDMVKNFLDVQKIEETIERPSKIRKIENI